MPDPFDPNDPDAPPVLGALNVQDNVQGANPFAPSDPYGGMGMFSPASLFDNKDFRRHAGYEALTNAGLALLAASAPSSTPQTAASAFGALAGGAAQGVQGSADKYMKQLQLGAQMQNMRMRQQMLSAPLPAPVDPDQQQAPQQATGALTQGGTAQTGKDETGGSADPYNQPNLAGSGAHGKYQFMPETAGALALKHPDLNLSMNVRNWTPEQQEAAKVAFDKDNGADLAQANIPATDATLYLAHRFGSAGATKFLSQPDDTKLADVFPAKWIEQNKDLQGVTVGQFKSAVAQRYAGMPGAQVAQAGGGPRQPPMPQGGDQPTGNQPGVMPAPQQGGLQLPPMPKPIPYNPQAQRMIEFGDAGMRELGKANNAQVDRLNAQRMERWKQNVALLQHNQTEARERQGMDLRTQNADVMPGGNLNQTKIEYGAQAELAKKKAEGDAHEQSVLGGKGWQDAPPDQFRKIANPQVISLADGLQKGTIRLSTLNSTTGRGGISITKDDVQAAGLKLYGDQWNPDSGDIRHKFEQDIKDPDTQAGKTTYALNVLNKHIDRFQDLMLAQKNGTAAPLMTKIRKELNDAAGYNKYTSAESLQPALATEMASAIKGSILNEPEVLGAIEQLKTTKSDPQMLDTLHTLRHTVGDRTSTFLEKAKDAYVPQDRIDRIIGPSAKAAGEHFDKVQEEYRTAHPEQFGGAPNAPVPKGAVRTFDPATGTLK